MRTFTDTQVQATILREMHELYEKRVKIEAGIRALDRCRTSQIEKDALLDITAYKARSCAHNLSGACPRFPSCSSCARFSRF
jgi:hypothetical protein